MSANSTTAGCSTIDSRKKKMASKFQAWQVLPLRKKLQFPIENILKQTDITFQEIMSY